MKASWDRRAKYSCIDTSQAFLERGFVKSQETIPPTDRQPALHPPGHTFACADWFSLVGCGQSPTTDPSTALLSSPAPSPAGRWRVVVGGGAVCRCRGGRGGWEGEGGVARKGRLLALPCRPLAGSSGRTSLQGVLSCHFVRSRSTFHPQWIQIMMALCVLDLGPAMHRYHDDRSQTEQQ